MTVGLEVTYYRTGPVRPSVVTSAPGAYSASNFGALTLTEIIKVTISFGNGTTVVFYVSVEDVVTVQQVVDAINLAYRNATLALTNGTEFTRAAVPVPIPGPYVFSNPSTRDSFFVSFNGNTPIHINPPAGEYSASSFAAYVNTQIAAAAQVAEGEAIALALTTGDPVRTVFRSKSFTGSGSKVQFLPGNPGGSVPGSFLETLNYLGITPGIYKGTECAALYGLDEIEFFCPSTLPNASMTIEPQAPSATTVASHWGLPYPSVTVSVTTGPVKVSVPSATVILPEMVEFHEEPDNYDSEIQDFDNRGDAAAIDPASGVGNVGLSALLGLTGKIDPSFIPSVLDSLNLNQLNLGTNRIKSATDQRSPRATYPYNPTFGAVLLWEGVDVVEPSSGGLTRMYLNGGDIYLTRNAKITNAGGDWTRDLASVDSAMFEFHSGKGAFAVWPGALSSTWTHASWQRNVTLNPFATADSPFRDGLVAIGEFANDSTKAVVPRLDIPTQLGVPTLMFAAKASTGVVIRGYVTNGTTAGTTYLEVTVNAKFNGSSFEKDITGQQATRFLFGAANGFEMSTRNAANNAAWSAWDAFPVKLDPVALVNHFQGQLKLGSGATDAYTSRLSADRFTPASNRRTLLFESPVNGALASIPIRIYLDTGNTAWTGWPTPDPGDGFLFTYNARWDGALDKWVQDIPTNRSYAYGFLDQRLWILSKVSGSAPWGDGWGPWDHYAVLELPGPGGDVYRGLGVKDGVIRVDGASTTSNPASTAVILHNAVYAKNICRSWGRATYYTNNYVVLDGFNAFGVNPNAFAFDMQFSTFVNNHVSIQLQYVQSNSLSAIGGPTSVAIAKPYGNIGVRFIFYIIRIDGNLYPQSDYAEVDHVVFGGNQ